MHFTFAIITELVPKNQLLNFLPPLTPFLKHSFLFILYLQKVREQFSRIASERMN